jgi:hypothetical protein
MTTKPHLTVISLGAGVQSTTMALMAAHGEITPMPDCAIFADTQWEPKAVYEHLELLERLLPFPIYRVSKGNLRAAALNGGYADIPWHTVNANGTAGMGRRQCTYQYKLRPIQQKIVQLCDGKRVKAGAEVWIGISTDEAFRMKPSRVKYIVNRWPLIDQRKSRADCYAWLARLGITAPKSSCIGCPYRSAAHWRSLTSDELSNAIEVDNGIRDRRAVQQFMHSSRRSLAEIDMRSDAEIGQADLFNNECEGMCGV